MFQDRISARKNGSILASSECLQFACRLSRRHGAPLSLGRSDRCVWRAREACLTSLLNHFEEETHPSLAFFVGTRFPLGDEEKSLRATRPGQIITIPRLL